MSDLVIEKQEIYPADPEDGLNSEKDHGSYVQWATSDNNLFFPAFKTIKQLNPGVYEFVNARGEVAAHKSNMFNIENLVKFKDSQISAIVEDINKFWKLKDKFKKHKVNYKRGILLYGPPGGGKSCAIKLIVQNVINRGGIAVVFKNLDATQIGLSRLKEIQPETPIVVIMEDIDAILEEYQISFILNILDGVGEYNNICFIATTNYPEKLEDRVKNRPSRFDKRYYVGLPDENVRIEYLNFLFSDLELEEQQDVDKWVKDTKNLSVSHIKELFISVCLYGNDYDESLTALRDMNKKIKSDDNGRKTGFRSNELSN